MRVQIKTEYSKEAEALRSEGEFERASDYYLRSATSRLTNYLGEENVDESNLNLALADVLAATIAAVRARNDKTAENLATLCAGLASLLTDRSNYQGFEGIAAEITGDCFLISGLNGKQHYRRAARVYNDFDEDECLNWGMEPEFEEAYLRFVEYIEGEEEFSDLQPAGDEDVQYDFKSRITKKTEHMKGQERGAK